MCAIGTQFCIHCQLTQTNPIVKGTMVICRKCGCSCVSIKDLIECPFCTHRNELLEKFCEGCGRPISRAPESANPNEGGDEGMK